MYRVVSHKIRLLQAFIGRPRSDVTEAFRHSKREIIRHIKAFASEHRQSLDLQQSYLQQSNLVTCGEATSTSLGSHWMRLRRHKKSYIKHLCRRFDIRLTQDKCVKALSTRNGSAQWLCKLQEGRATFVGLDCRSLKVFESP